jgi:hypothetical protein
MIDPNDQFDIPTLDSAGPHKEQLRRALMREARARSEGRATALALPWLRVGAWAAAVTVLVGTFWFAYRQRGVIFADRASTQPTGRGFSAAIGNSSRNSPDAQRQAARIAEAINSFDLRLEQILPTSAGGRAYVYRTLPADGIREIAFASDRLLSTHALQNPVLEQLFALAIERGEGRFVGEIVTDAGARLYRYRVSFSNGMSETYTCDREPDALRSEQHRQELVQAIAQGRGELAVTLPTTSGATVSLVKVTLSDGIVRFYAKETTSNRQ